MKKIITAILFPLLFLGAGCTQAAQSPAVTPDANTSIEAAQLWLHENAHIYDTLTHATEAPLLLTWHEDNLVDLATEHNTITHYDFDGDHYHVTSIFKGEVIVQDKDTGAYAVLWVPPTIYDWVPRTDVNTDNSIMLYSQDNTPQYRVEILKRKITRM